MWFLMGGGSQFGGGWGGGGWVGGGDSNCECTLPDH